MFKINQIVHIFLADGMVPSIVLSRVLFRVCSRLCPGCAQSVLGVTPVTPIALTLLKRHRVTLDTLGCVKISKSCCCCSIYYSAPCRKELLLELTIAEEICCI